MKSVEELQEEIQELTHRPVVSTDRRYLQIRLAALRRMERKDLPNRKSKNDRATPVTISLGAKRLALAEKMRGSLTMSALVRRALDEYGARHGFAVEVERLTQREARNG